MPSRDLPLTSPVPMLAYETSPDLMWRNERFYRTGAFHLVGKKPEATTLAFVPTAANVELGDKGWLIDDLVNLKKLNFKAIDIVDISALDRTLWLSKMEQADVLYFSGGKRYHLMQWMTRSGLTEVLPDLLKDRVYVGMSAG